MGCFMDNLATAVLNHYRVLKTATVLLLISTLWKFTEAGSCWAKIEENGRCQELLQSGISREQCCSSSPVNVGWSPQDEWFYYQYLAGGATPCYACHATCDKVNCQDPDKKCRVKDGRARCVCAPVCNNHDERSQGPVCSMDGNTYKNYCTLLKFNCRKGRHLEVDYYGRCQYSCDKVQCEGGKSCVLDQNGLPHCLSCRTHCPPARPSEKVCGADGVTYASMCHLQKATCQLGRSITVAYRGECDNSLSCSRISCDPGQKCLLNPGTMKPQCYACDGSCAHLTPTNPICGTDGESYSSWCNMRNNACRSGIVIDTLHYGPCVRDGTFRDYNRQGDEYLDYYSP